MIHLFKSNERGTSIKLKLLALLLTVTTLVPVAAGCADAATATTTADTTVATTEAPEPEEPEVRTTEFAEPARELMHQIIDDYWISRSKSLRAEPKSGNAPAVWAYTSFIEALAEAYRLFPDDATISKTYKDALVGLESYAVTSNITTPSGRYKVTYYNATKGGQGDYYYDDDAWICIQFLNAYELLKDPQYL